MKITLSTIFLFSVLFAPSALAIEPPSENTKTAVVFIANYDSKNNFLGWGSGFYVDEGIVVTNKHVIESGMKYRVMVVQSANSEPCYQDITRSDVKINLDDDVAYMRAFVPCEHGIVHFDFSELEIGEEIGVLGFPAEEDLADSMKLALTTGKVTNKSFGKWYATSAYMHFGNSGGPIIKDGKVVGVAVAKSTDSEGKFESGLFIPVSTIIDGLLYANDSKFAYTPQDDQAIFEYEQQRQAEMAKNYGPFNPKTSSEFATNADCKASLGSGGEATGHGGCRCKDSYHEDEARTMCIPGAAGYQDRYQRRTRDRGIASNSTDSVDQPSITLETVKPDFVHKMYDRVCPRVLRRFVDNESVWERVNKRILNRFGFVCSK